MGRPTANPNTHGQPPLQPPQFNQQPPPQYHHQEQVNAATDPHEALQTPDHVPPPYTDHHDHDSSSSSDDDEDQAKLEMVPYDHLSPSEPPQPQMAPPPTPDQAYPQNPPPQQQVYHQNPPPQQAYLPNAPPQKTQPYPPQQGAFQGTYPPQAQPQPQAYPPPQAQHQPKAYPPPQAYPPPHNAQGPVQFPPPQPQGPVQFPPPQPQGPVQFPPPMNNSQATHTPQHHMDGMPPSPYKANVSQGVPVPVGGTNPWSSDLFACMDDPESAILTAFCPCMTFGQIAEIVDNGQTSCATSGSLYGVVALALIPCLVASPYRLKLRNRYNLVETLPDWLAHWLFPWCALCQEYRELQHRGFDPSIGWIGNVARAQMQQQQAGMTPPVNQAMTGL